MKIRGQGFASLHSVEEAQRILQDHCPPPQRIISISPSSALGYRLAEDVFASENLPGFRRAAMDGFAIRAEDSYGVSGSSPRLLRTIGHIEIGDTKDLVLESGDAVSISTGAPVPPTADAVLRLEDCEIIGSDIEIYAAIPPGRNITSEDEDVKQGELLLKRETIIQPWDIGMITANSIDEIKVFAPIRLATVSTGNEVVSSQPKSGQVIDSSTPAIHAWLEYLRCDLVDTRHCIDDPELIRTTLMDLAPQADLLITTGGTSVGMKDFLAEVIADIGEVWVHGVSIRPGKPVILGRIQHERGSTPIIALPGNPLAAFLNFNLFVSLLIESWTGQQGLLSKKTTVKLTDKIPSKVGTRDFVRLRKTNHGAGLIRITGAGILSSLVHADYLLDIPDDIEGYNPGDSVEVFVLR